ncbi:UbiD family decarboxylase [Natronococcus occultus]|uniref:3-polyprenyl-4-hydroxybenzoate decarboxylase-like protein n=1 Tax=Natronococcus occultus SP4 TaxID=694430 RepID=L0JXJ8_9EURY|nr:UbiD family decarboxylase [Natronococcus occultus]AGB36588.1 3-polyprenyl-4-hydroxybenzoate decarboxylase-like protein [Natronococcus occultus SP4]
MTTLRQQLERLRETDDLVPVAERVHWDATAASVAAEATRHNCPATLFEDTPGEVRLASGVFGGPDQFTSLDRHPWQRTAQALGFDPDCSYETVVERLASRTTAPTEGSPDGEPDATPLENVDLYGLGLPTSDDGSPLVSLGVLAATRDGVTTWVPIRGVALRNATLRLVVPQVAADWLGPQADASVVLGVGAVPLVAALQGWTQDRITPDVPGLTAGIGDVSMATVDSRTVPSSADVRIDGGMTVDRTAPEPSGPKAAWERSCETAVIDMSVDRIATREEPVVAFTPLGEPLTDDLHLVSLVEAAQLFRRVNSYWGVSPVEWIRLPVESRLGLCIVSSEILYAGFEWQLANTLFSFSKLFDKVLVLDENADPTNLARSIDDMWVKAHPGNDWIFSEPNAPSATAPRYRQDGETGSRLYINATWDPHWDEEYIAPQVTFETSFSENVKEALEERWEELGLDELVESNDR